MSEVTKTRRFASQRFSPQHESTSQENFGRISIKNSVLIKLFAFASEFEFDWFGFDSNIKIYFLVFLGGVAPAKFSCRHREENRKVLSSIFPPLCWQ